VGLREFIKSKPWLGWALACALLLVVVMVWYRSLNAGNNDYSVARMAQVVTIRDRETGEEWTMPRGQMEQFLWDRPLPIDPNIGIPNPKTGKSTGFPKSEWEATVDRISKEREVTVGSTGRPKPAPRKTPK
jgi:hypothetical protein